MTEQNPITARGECDRTKPLQLVSGLVCVELLSLVVMKSAFTHVISWVTFEVSSWTQKKVRFYSHWGIWFCACGQVHFRDKDWLLAQEWTSWCIHIGLFSNDTGSVLGYSLFYFCLPTGHYLEPPEPVSVIIIVILHISVVTSTVQNSM